MKNEFRHPDHQWEPNLKDIEIIILNIFKKEKFNVNIQPIGDGIDGVHVFFF